MFNSQFSSPFYRRHVNEDPKSLRDSSQWGAAIAAIVERQRALLQKDPQKVLNYLAAMEQVGQQRKQVDTRRLRAAAAMLDIDPRYLEIKGGGKRSRSSKSGIMYGPLGGFKSEEKQGGYPPPPAESFEEILQPRPQPPQLTEQQFEQLSRALVAAEGRRQ